MEHAQTAVSSAALRIADAAVEEFLALSRVPHPSGHCGPMHRYLQEWAERHGMRWGSDGDGADNGNIWIDAPAAPGYEDRPKAIIQAHMDMVCVADAGVAIDFTTQPIEVVREGDLLTARGTTLGADDGAGLAFGLALAACAEGRGPLRILATWDEETTMAGAESLAAEALDADYLINIDNDIPGEVVVSSAGVVEGTLRGRFATAPVDAASEALIRIELTGFAGGHSGGEIHRGRVNAIDALADALADVSAGAPVGVAVRLVYLEGGSASNAIPTWARARIAVPRESCERVRAGLIAAFAALVAVHPDENGHFDVAPCDGESAACGEPVDALTAAETARLLGLIRSLPRGVIAMSPVVEGLVQASNNLGLAQVEGGDIALTVAARSCEETDLAELRTRFEVVAAQQGMAFEDPVMIPAWPARPDNRLCDLLLEGYEHAGAAGVRAAVHGGLEPSWFCRIKPSLQMVSCGPAYWGAHSTDETMDLASFPAFAAALLYTLARL